MAILKLGNSNSSFSGSFSGSFEGDGSGLTNVTASFSPTSSYALTASYVETAQTASYVTTSSIDGITNYVRNDQTSSMTVLSSSFAISSSHSETTDFILGGNVSGPVADAVDAVSSSYSATASYVETTQNSISSSYALTASYAVSASHEIIKEVSSSYADTASFAQSGDGIFSGSFSGSFEGDGSEITGVISSSYALTASYVNPLTQDVDITGQTDITGNVLVTGSLTVSGSNSIVNLQELQFDTEHIATGHSTGRMYWDDSNKTATLDMQGSDVRLQLGQEEHVYATNISGVTIANGDAVRISGATGANLNIELAVSKIKSFKSSTEEDEILGIATEEILNNQSGYVTTFGSVGDLDTSAFSEGDILYLSNTTSGSYSNTKPPAPYFEARVGVVKVSNNGEGVIISRPAEPIFLTDISQVTSSGVIPNEKTYLCYDDSTDLINFTNEFSGSFSGSFEGDGFGLTDVPVTVTNTLWVSPVGDDSTAIKGNLQRPWASVSASVAAASSGDSIIMEPGTYIEPPFTLSSGVTLKSLGGLKSTTISASNNSATFITQEVNSRLEGFTLVCPSGAFPGISYDNVGTGTIYDVTLKGQGNSIGFQISQSIAGPSNISKVIYNEIRYGGGNFDKLLYVKGGIFACDGIHVPGGGNIDKIYHVEAGRLQAINTNAGNPNVSSSFYIEGGTNIILGTNLFNVQEAFHVAGQPYTIQGMNVYIDDNVPKHVTIDPGISGSNSQINFVAAHMEAAKITATPAFVNSDHAFVFQDDGTTLKPAFRVYTDLEVGHANKGFTLGAGEGLPYNKGMEIWGSGSGGVSQSLTVAATSKDGSTFDFPYSASGDYMYFGNKQKSPNIADQYLYFTGLQYQQVSTGSYSPGDVTLEIFTTASTWENIDGAQAVSSEEGYNYANNIFSHNDSEEEIIAKVNLDVWATSSNFGIEARWGRIRLINAITTSPVFEQFIYTPNTTLINPKGQLSFRGKALQRQTISIIGNTWGDTGLANAELDDIGADIDWDHLVMNVKINGPNDRAYNQLTIPAGTCTAYPLEIDVTFRVETGGDIQLDVATVKNSGISINDPDGGKIPVPRTLAAADDFTTSTVPITSFNESLSASEFKLQTVKFSPIDISSYYEGDTILIRLLRGTTGNAVVDIIDTNVSFMKWTLGERS